MGHYLLTILGFCFAVIVYWGSDRRARGILFHVLWFTGLIMLLLSLFFYQSITLFDQDLRQFPLYQKLNLIGYGLLIICRVLAIIMGKSAIYKELAEERQQRAISEITQLAASSGSLMELLNFAIDKIINILNMSAGAVHIYHAARQNLVLGSYIGLSPRMARRLETLGLEDTAIGRTARNKRLLIIRNLRLSHDYEVFGGKTEGFTHMALIPIASFGEQWGVISILGKGSYQPGKLRVDLLEQFGEQLGSALVLGRRMRSTINSLENSRAFISSLGDELFVTSRLAGTGRGAVRGITWTLTRILGGDRFDLVEKSGVNWKINLSSEPEAVGKELTLNHQLDIDITAAPSGLISWNQDPPFEEFAERRSYAFCAMPDKTEVLFIRMEGRRKSSVDFEFFYNACKIIHGLSLRLIEPGKPGREIPGTLLLKRGPESAASVEKASGKFKKISSDLEKLIGDYSGADGGPELKSLISWLELINESAHEGVDFLRELTSSGEKKIAKKAARPRKKAGITRASATERMRDKEKPAESAPVRILAVDSQDVIRDLLTGMLGGMGYDAVVVAESETAISEFHKARESKDGFRMVIADNVLDNISGLELSVRLKEIDPAISFILIAGWGQDPEPSEIENSGVDRVLKKPFRIEQLAEVIGKLLGESQSA